MWHIDGTTARLDLADFTARVDVRQVAAGVGGLRCGDSEIADASILQVRSTGTMTELLDSYVRAQDLIAGYSLTPDRSVELQVYWRFVEHPDLSAVGIELIASVQTSLLISQTRVEVGSRLPLCDVCGLAVAGLETPSPTRVLGLATEDARTEVAAVAGTDSGTNAPMVYRIRSLPHSYVELPYPGDFATTGRLPPAVDGTESAYLLSATRLEKGVIRRGRLQGLFIRRDGDLDRVAECYRRFLASEPPLAA
jgi:hypothetical protein